MEVSFASERLAALLLSERDRRRRYGAENAKLIPRRLDTLRFAANLDVVRTLPGRLHELKGDRKGTLAMDLKGGYRLILSAADEPAPCKADGGLDLAAITAVIVLGIKDYHE